MILENYVAVDLEMTGLNPGRDHILEIGAVRIENKQVAGTFQALICPHLTLPEEVAALTGITNEMASSGQELEEVFPAFMEFCREDILLGHNVVFDYGFLKQAAVNRKIPFERMGIDTLKIARKLLPEAEKKTLQHLCDCYGIERLRMHRALDDAKATRELYELLETQFEETHPEVFMPYPLVYKAKKQSPATARQKKHLKALADYYTLELNIPWETLTKNEASRQIDRIIAQYGRMPEQDRLPENGGQLQQASPTS